MKNYTVYDTNNKVWFETDDKHEMDMFFMVNRTGDLYLFHEEDGFFIMYFEDCVIYKKMS